MSYKKPALIELYAQFQMEPESLPPERFFDVVPRLRERGFVTVEFGGVSGIRVSAEEIEGSVTPRIRCWSADRAQLVQLGPDLVVVNLVSPEGRYPGWAPFTDLVRKLLETLTISLKQDPRFLSISLTAIDQFRVARERFQRIDDYLQCDGTILPTWLSRVAVPFDASLGKGFIALDGFNRALQVRGRVTNGEYEIRFQSVFHDRLGAGQTPLGLLERLHDEANTTFESLITDRVREEVMGGVANANAVNV